MDEPVLDLPTQAQDAEVSLLGAAMLGADIDTLAEIVTPSDFYSPHNEETWDAILRVHAGGVKPDVVSVRLALASAEPTSSRGARKLDQLQLFRMTELVPNVGQASYYARQVANAAGMRAIQSAGIKIAQLGGTHGDLDETRERARQVVDDATRGRHVSRARTVADIMPAVLETAEHGQAATLATGWPDIDRLIGGLAPGRFIVVGASPGGGKSVMGTNLALHVASRHDHAVLFASMEMPEHEVGQRMLAAHARADLTGLAYGQTDEATWTRIGVHLQELMDLPITIDDTPVQTMAHITRAARNVQRQRDDLALIVVDYLQLIRPLDTSVIRSEQVSTIARGLKLLARETGACVVGLTQLNREPSKRAGAPTMTDLREAAIENDADQVILLHCPDEDLPEIEAVVAKNRHGSMGAAMLQFQGHYARFVSNEWRA